MIRGYLAPHQQDFFGKVCGIEKVSVFREAKGDGIDITMYYHRDGKRERADFHATLEEIELADYMAEWYLVGRAVEVVKQYNL